MTNIVCAEVPEEMLVSTHAVSNCKRARKKVAETHLVAKLAAEDQ
jgi:hypothetical protein